MVIDKQKATFIHTLAFIFLNTTTMRCMILVTFPDQDFAYSTVGCFEDALEAVRNIDALKQYDGKGQRPS